LRRGKKEELSKRKRGDLSAYTKETIFVHEIRMRDRERKMREGKRIVRGQW